MQGLNSPTLHHSSGMMRSIIKPATCPSRLHTLRPFATKKTGPTLHFPSLQAAQAQSSPSDQPGNSQTEFEAFTPLTKARKIKKQSKLVGSLSQQETAGSAAVAMAADAGAAITALAVNASQAAVAAGAAVLPVAGKGTGRRAGTGASAPLFGAMSRGMNAAQNFTRALHSKRRSTQPVSLQRLAATSQQSAGETASADSRVVQPLEIEVVYEPSSPVEGSSPVEQHLEEDVVRRLLEEFEDDEWRQLAKVIQSQPCPVSMDAAILFAEQFNPAYQLFGETVDPAVHNSQQPKVHVENSAEPSRKEKLKHKEKKKRRKRRKAT